VQTSHRFITIIFASIITVLVIFGMSVFYKVEIHNPEIIEIPKGSNTNSISNLLHQNKLILNPSLFKLYSRLTASDESYKAGEYLFKSPESIHTLIHKITDGNFFYRKLTILPGLSLNEILKLGSSPGLINDLGNSLEIAHQSKSISLQEGIFFPDTYFYLKDETFSSILIRSHESWKTASASLWQERQDNLPFTKLEEAVTLASIIEKEGLEKRMIAGVFINRLRKGMKLQSDPTVIYALGDNFDGNIKRKDLRIDSPYNTYRYKGLPPTPISTVSEESLSAALNPSTNDYLYFVSMGNGFHKFSKTLSEHNKAVLEYQINAR
jgi:UPF0755 protein